MKTLLFLLVTIYKRQVVFLKKFSERFHSFPMVGIASIVLVLSLISCNYGEEPASKPETEGSETGSHADESSEETEQTNISLMIHWGENDFEKFFRHHVEEALPHITLEHIQASNQQEIEESFARGEFPDLVMGSDFELYRNLDLLRDQTPLIEAHGLDLNRFDPNIITSLYEHSQEDELSAIPLFRPDYVMSYNKDIFDLFGVDYPEDGLTWDEAIELAESLTGEIDGVQYHGLWPDKEQLTQVGSQLLHGETHEPNILDNDELRVFLERQQRIFFYSW